MNDISAILETLEDYATAYCDKDVPRLMSLFDDEAEITVIGTGADELCSSRDQIDALFQRNFAEATANRFEWQWRHVTLSGDTAVVAASLIIHLDSANGALSVPLRWTVALVNRNGRWRWLHRHASAAAGGQQAGTAYPHDPQDIRE